ncbi:ubiquinone binding protein Coq10 [Schizosaccharomyces japonicus yFS275]|uniref:Ubiquinone binding protein Coq10 n=1 Tax=Schizosaccharomyces japonicus (strain yFS275 / FY16936) TaxID=402676 RepID=B6K696_SCHJY|nr:ubiquinone binding protein Coq10 [Schizosaccharomyces japonicus yFS275]EEB09049.1 ubiquinone binding protein Coq10 [Schizosaccharomyces japonicus yFS275]
MSFRCTPLLFQTFTTSRLMSFPPKFLFSVVSDIDTYKEFVPFCQDSKVTTRDEKTNLPTTADLTIGFRGFSETFDSKVQCNPEKLTVLADASHHKLFSYLKTQWQIHESSNNRSRVELSVAYEFQNPLYRFMSKMAGQAAATDIITGFVAQARRKYNNQIGFKV